MGRDTDHWAVVDLLKTTTSFFESRDLENARLNAEYLLAHILQVSRIQLYLQYDRILLRVELEAFRAAVKRRLAGEPLQYIVGNTEFMGLTFRVDPSVLIPRPETELLVEQVLAVKELFKSPPAIWDIGTGSGCIAISLSKLWPEVHVTATDVSEAALQTARQNADDNEAGENLLFEQNDVLRDPAPGAFEIICSNPPYVTDQEFAGLAGEIRDHEPQIAVTDFGDGTLFYERIIQLIADMPECKFGFLEISGTGTDRYIQLLKEHGLTEFEIIQDLGGKDRLIKIRTNNG